MSSRPQLQPFFNNSLSIRQEIQRFESVHPSIYAIYDLIELVPEGIVAQQIRDHVVCIEDSFVNSQEWTMSRSVPDLRLGIVGALSSGKSALVHRYLTGSYMQEESPEGGRFKKEVMVDGQSYLLLIRDEGGPPEMQFAAWVDAVIFVFSLENEASFNDIYAYYNKMSHLRNSTEIPLILVGTQDTISENNPRVIDDVKARKLATDLKRCSYYETCATYGLNVERVFQDACQKIVQQRLSSSTSCLTPSNSRPSTPLGLPPGPTLRPQPNVSTLHSTHSPSHNHTTFGLKDTLSRGNHPLSASSNHLHRTTGGSNDSSSSSHLVEVHGLNGPDSTRWGHTLASHASTQGLVTIAMENNNIAKFAAPACLDNLQAPTTVFKDPKDLPTPSSTPTTSRKSRRRSNLFTPSKKGDDKFKNGELGSGRAIPLKQGYLHKKSSKALNKEWKKKYVALCDDGKLTYHPSINDYMENVHGKEISLQYVTVKVPGQKPRGSKSIITTLPGGHHAYNGSTLHDSIGGLSLSGYQSKDGKSQRLTDKVLLTAYEVLKEPGGRSLLGGPNAAQDDTSANSLVLNTNGEAVSSGTKLETPHVKKRHRRMKSSGMKKDGDGDDQEVYEFCIVSLDGKKWRFDAGNCEERDAWVAAVEKQILASLQGPGGAEAALSRHFHLVPGNNACVDCDAADPGWASLNLGVLMCIECSGVHRNLGSHISRVRSLELDEWPAGHLSVMLSIGNSLANSVWEADLKGHCKPSPTSSREDKERWIRLKYQSKAFLSSGECEESIGDACNIALLSGGLQPLLAALARSEPADVNHPRPLHRACAAGDLPVAQLLIWNNANPNLLDADNISCLELARIAATQVAVSPAHRPSHLQVTCPVHHIQSTSGTNSTSSSTGSTKNQQASSSPSQLSTCICSLLKMLSPANSAKSLIDLLIALQNNSIANSISNNAFTGQNLAVSNTPLNASQNTLFGMGNDSHGSGTSLNSNNGAFVGFLVPSSNTTIGRHTSQGNNLALGNGRCHQPPVGGSVV